MTLLYKVFSFQTTHSPSTLQLEKVTLIFQQEGIGYSQTIAGIYYALFFRSPSVKSGLMPASVALSVPRSTGWDWDCIIFWFDLWHITCSQTCRAVVGQYIITWLRAWPLWPQAYLWTPVSPSFFSSSWLCGHEQVPWHICTYFLLYKLGLMIRYHGAIEKIVVLLLFLSF